MFIVVEGIDGSGKTTLIEEISKQLAADGHDSFITSELGKDMPGSQLWRDELMKSAGDARAEYDVIRTVRWDRDTHILKPKLQAGRTVLMDRFILSTIGYQGQFTSPHHPTVREIIDDHRMFGWKTPDLTILLDCDPVTAHERSIERGKVDAFDSRGLDFFKRARELMSSFIFTLEGKSLTNGVLINAERPADVVAALAMEQVNELMKRKEAA